MQYEIIKNMPKHIENMRMAESINRLESKARGLVIPWLTARYKISRIHAINIYDLWKVL